MATPQKPPVEVPLAWGENPDLRTIHANHLWLSQQEGDIFLTFGELPPVPVPGASKLPEKVYIRPVARISVSPLALTRMVRLLQDNFAADTRGKAGA